MTAAANAEWPGTRLQRCLVLVHRDTNRDLTHHPRTQAAKELRKLSSRLFKVSDAEGAARWGEGRPSPCDGVPWDTNGLEGGINSPIKRMLDDHRGMPRGHMMRACEWKCYMRSLHPDIKATLDTYLENRRRKAERTGKETAAEQARTGDEPGIGTGVDWNEFHTSTRYSDATD